MNRRWPHSLTRTALAVAMIWLPTSGCSALKSTLQLGNSSHDRGRLNVSGLEAAECTVPGCAVPGCVHVTPSAGGTTSPGQVTPVPGAADPVTGAVIHPVPGEIHGPLMFPPTGADQKSPTGLNINQEADSIAECRREAADLKRRLELMESELTSYQRSSETMHLAHSSMNTQLERVARDNLHLQSELRRIQAAAERQHQSDIASLDALSQLIEHKMNSDGENSHSMSNETPDE